MPLRARCDAIRADLRAGLLEAAFLKAEALLDSHRDDEAALEFLANNPLDLRVLILLRSLSTSPT